MKLTRLLLTLALAVPGAATPVAAQDSTAMASKALLDAMQANVDRISPSLENDRWTANIALWTARLNHPGRLDRTVVANMRTPFGKIVNIVSQLRGPEEKDRWEANRDMWDYYLSSAGEPSGTTLTAMRNLLRRMEANVVQIAAYGEHERWSANVALWKQALPRN